MLKQNNLGSVGYFLALYWSWPCYGPLITSRFIPQKHHEMERHGYKVKYTAGNNFNITQVVNTIYKIKDKRLLGRCFSIMGKPD